jgi:YD repeat-containing protein
LDYPGIRRVEPRDFRHHAGQRNGKYELQRQQHDGDGQAGKVRKTVTDALGRLIDVFEEPDVPGGPVELNYQTTYNYDVLDNLVKVTQGTQQRFFMFDSLKRLIRARNPEQSTNSSLNLSDPLTGNSAWSIGYQYDASGNLTQKTDPRGVVSVYVYDALNRNTTVDYSDTASINPDLTRVYDGATNGKGRFWNVYSGGDLSTGSNVDHTSVDSYDGMGRPPGPTPVIQAQQHLESNLSDVARLQSRR